MRSVYIAIMVAAATGKGLRLSEDEVLDLSMDDAISTCASNQLSEEEFAADKYGTPGFDWKKIDPKKDRNADDAAHLAGFHRDDPDRLGKTRKRS